MCVACTATNAQARATLDRAARVHCHAARWGSPCDMCLRNGATCSLEGGDKGASGTTAVENNSNGGTQSPLKASPAPSVEGTGPHPLASPTNSVPDAQDLAPLESTSLSHDTTTNTIGPATPATPSSVEPSSSADSRPRASSTSSISVTIRPKPAQHLINAALADADSQASSAPDTRIEPSVNSPATHRVDPAYNGLADPLVQRVAALEAAIFRLSGVVERLEGVLAGRG
ncbi:hypothetical protein PsYK624_137470 [Phanerochaete sordida]|uniref:Uncharacterized protein n=1 Tax=Phanerochaete sordida TaxID=48140 RepID=A0A9P3LJG9_9APHY|nr:hypothetical protein PsYK624_137470 [Phanerochaete sordida]